MRILDSIASTSSFSCVRMPFDFGKSPSGIQEQDPLVRQAVEIMLHHCLVVETRLDLFPYQVPACTILICVEPRVHRGER